MRKRYLLLALAFALLVVGGGAMLYSRDVAVGALGFLALLSSGRVAQMSRPKSASRPDLDDASKPRASRGTWVFGFALIAAAGVAFRVMQVDAAHGGHEAWPAYAFAGVMVLLGLVWGYLLVWGV
jgi:hypothetical protein